MEHAIEVIGGHVARAKLSIASDPVMAALEQPMEEWVVESLIQRAWLREYQEWEKATKGYFEGQHQRNGTAKPDWKAKIASSTGAVSHVDRVRAQLFLFGASVSQTILDTLSLCAASTGGIVWVKRVDHRAYLLPEIEISFGDALGC